MNSIWKRIKCYWVYLPVLCRVLLLLWMTLTTLFLCMVCGEGRTKIVVVAITFCFAELIIDHWGFGGILSRQTAGIEYIKCSGYGPTFMRNVFRFDQIRRFINILLLMLLLYVLQIKGITTGEEGNQNAPISYFLLTGCLIYILSAVGIFLSRFQGYLWINIMIANILVIVIILVILATFAWNYAKVLFVILPICGILIAALSVKTAEKRVRRSYYDERN